MSVYAAWRSLRTEPAVASESRDKEAQQHRDHVLLNTDEIQITKITLR
jgi:hypothetical protein